MVYFALRDDLVFLKHFKAAVEEFLRWEDREIPATTVTQINEALAKHKALRQRIARGTPRAKRIARAVEAPTDLVTYPAVGGAPIPVNTIDAILVDDGHKKISNQRKLDVLEQAIGACEEDLRKEFFHLINPLYWISRLIQFILRLPFLTLEAAGFRPESFEKSLAGKFVRLIELIGIAVALVYLGFNRAEIKEIVAGLLR